MVRGSLMFIQLEGLADRSLDAHRHAQHGFSNSSLEGKTASYLSSVRSHRREIDEEQSTGLGQPGIQKLISAPAGRSSGNDRQHGEAAAGLPPSPCSHYR